MAPMNRHFHTRRHGKFERLEERRVLDASSLELVTVLGANANEASATSALETSGAGAAADILPDLVALADNANGWMHGWSIDTTEQPGNTLLRLTTAMGNTGEGAMEIRGGAALPGGGQEVFQRIYNDMGGSRDRLAGTFTYHPTHGHTHFDGFAQYHLREVTVDNGVGAIIASGDKVSFCLLDSEEFEPGAAPESYFTCTTTRQGISSGWADVYDQGLPDQWIDITGVPDGQYWLEVVADPDNHILETNESNNTERILIDLGGGSGTGDRFEVNNTFATATDLGALGELSELDLSIHEPNDDDYYTFTAAANGNIGISIFFTNALGDVDMELFDSSQVSIDSSTSTKDSENLVISALAGETYYLHVYGFDGDTNPDYDLVIGGFGGDQFESNDSFAGAHDLGTMGDFSASGLSIHVPGNDDYFLITAADNGIVNVSLSFTHALGDVDLQVFDINENFVDSSTSTTDSEFVSFSALAGQSFYVHVYGFDDATNPNYSLTIDGPGMPPDAYEVNNTFATAADLGPVGEQNIDGLSIHESNDDDYYTFTAAANGNIDISIFFTNALGDVDMELFDSSQVSIDSSTSTDDSENLVISALAGETYYLHVYGFDGDTNPDYDLVIDGPAYPLDAYEPNDSFAAAFSLGAVQNFNVNGLSIHATGNDDYYSIVAGSNGTLTVDIDFTHAYGDVDLQVFNAAQVQIGLSNSTANQEHLSVPVTAGATYVVRVYGFSGATNPIYNMAISAPLQGDYNSDGSVDAGDYVTWRRTYGTSVAPYTGADGNGDSMVDADDYIVWRANFGATAAGGGSSALQTSVANAEKTPSTATQRLRDVHLPLSSTKPVEGFAASIERSMTQPNIVAKPLVNEALIAAEVSTRHKDDSVILMGLLDAPTGTAHPRSFSAAAQKGLPVWSRASADLLLAEPQFAARAKAAAFDQEADWEVEHTASERAEEAGDSLLIAIDQAFDLFD